MTEPLIYNEIESVFKNINSAIGDKDIEEPNAKEIISHLVKDGGGIEVYGDTFKPQHERAEEIQKRAKKHYKVACGIDGSTTKDLTYNNGLILSASVAGVSFTGKQGISDINDKKNICVSAYFDDNKLGIDQSYENDNTTVTVNQLDRVNYLTKDLSKWISSLSRSYAEGKQFEYISKNVTEPIFVDGPLLPTDILIWILYHQKNDSRSTPMENWPEYVQKIMQFYINGIENCILSNTPVFGVQKTTYSTRILDAISEKEPTLTRKDMPWTNDSVLFTKALQQDEINGAVISYTPWYVENNIKIGGNHGRVIPFKNYDGIQLKHGSAEEYRRAFFYAKPPNKKTVYRIGVPEMMFERGYDKDILRDIALAEMAPKFSEPLPIVLADEKVRISRNIREKIRKLITTEEPNINHNEGRNYE